MTPETGRWAQEKHRLFFNYASIFSTSMKKKWVRAYIDLFAGAGHAQLEGTERIVLGSPLLALEVNDPFDQYVFCEKKGDRLAALEERVPKRTAIQPAYFPGNVHGQVDEILEKVPGGALTFCFADPYGSDLPFDTVRRLANARRMDLMLVFASGMDLVRNFHGAYMEADNKRTAAFLGRPDWRERWVVAKAEHPGLTETLFLAREYGLSMQDLGYLPLDTTTMYQVSHPDYHYALYHLAFFAKHEKAIGFWKEAVKYATEQRPLF